MHKFIYLIWGCFCFGFFACNGENGHSKAPENASTPTPPAKPQFETGKVYPSESIAGTTSSYAFYLPKGYSKIKPTALIVFYDSHARGKDPVTRYQTLADQFQILLVGSNVSRNGQVPNQSIQIHDELMRDLRTKFNIDEQRITACGFSGGARVAATIAQNRPEVRNVIACSAGFQPRPGDTFGYYAIIGDEDFNYQELRQLESVMDQGTQRHAFTYWDGGHEWPSWMAMKHAFEFVKLRGMSPQDPSLDSLAQEVLKPFRALNAQIEPDLLKKWRRYKTLIAKLDGLIDLQKEKQELAKYETSDEWYRGKASEDRNRDEEMVLREQYLPMIATKSVEEWKVLVQQLAPKSTSARSMEDNMRRRVLNFLSLNTYFQVDGALKAGDLSATEHFLQIYALVDPTNPEHAYLTAVVRMRQGRPDDALASLQAAQALGFKDADRLAIDPEFANLASNPAFIQLLQQVGATE